MKKVEKFLDKVIKEGYIENKSYIAPVHFKDNYEVVTDFECNGWEYDWHLMINYKNTLISIWGCGYEGTISGEAHIEEE